MFLVVTSKRYDGLWRAWIQRGEIRVAFATGSSETEAIKAARANYKAGRK